MQDNSSTYTGSLKFNLLYILMLLWHRFCTTFLYDKDVIFKDFLHRRIPTRLNHASTSAYLTCYQSQTLFMASRKIYPNKEDSMCTNWSQLLALLPLDLSRPHDTTQPTQNHRHCLATMSKIPSKLCLSNLRFVQIEPSFH